MLRASILAIAAVMLAGCDDESETAAVEGGEVTVVEEEPAAEAEVGAAAAEEGEESLAETTEDAGDRASGAPEEGVGAYPTAPKSLYGLGGGQDDGAEEPTAGEAAAADEGTAGAEPAED